MSDQDTYKKLQLLGAQIAHYMAGSWRLDSRPIKAERHYMGVVLLGGDGLTIRLQDAARMRKQGMIYIYGEIPDFGLNHNERYSAGLERTSKSINVSWGRSAKSIAGDIQRRLIPAYIKAVAKAESQAQQFKQRMDTLKHIENVFRKITPNLRRYRGHEYETRREYAFPAKGQYCSHTLVISGYGSVSCDLKLNDLTPDTAMQILALLQNENGSKPP